MLDPRAARLDDRAEGRGQIARGSLDEAARLALLLALRRRVPIRGCGRYLVRLVLRRFIDLIPREDHEGCKYQSAADERDQDDGPVDHTPSIGRVHG